MKTCAKCKQNLPLDKFVVDKTRKDGFHSYCRICKGKQDKEWIKNNQEKFRESHRKNAYGITSNEYNTMLTEQEHKCIICQQQMVTPHVDHDHNTGKVRGLLCMQCNTALGKFKDDVDTLQRAIDYLNRTK